MKKFLPLIALAAGAIIMVGCGPVDTPTQPAVPSPTNTPTQTAAPTPTNTPTQTATPTPSTETVTCNELSFQLDPALGNGGKCESVPESSSSDLPKGMAYVFIYPAHTELTIQNYPLSKTQSPPGIWVYPVSRFEELLPDYIPPRVADLKKLISGGSWSGGALPFLPANPQYQPFIIHETNLSFHGGAGIRFLTAYIEIHPITNKNIIYTFQGLTDDGKYWVAVTLPISSPILPADYDTLPEGHTLESLLQNFSSYVSDLKKELDAQAPDSFSPTIDSLDDLVKTIVIRK